MKKKIAALVATFMFALTGTSMAGDCVWPYIGVVGGAAFTGSNTVDIADGYSVGGVAGLEYCNSRIEAEVTYRSSHIDQLTLGSVSGNFHLMSYMLNGLLEIDVNSKKWRPYLGLGAGLASADISSITSGGVQISGGTSATKFAYQGIAGIGYFLTPNLVIDGSYRYFSTSKYRFDGLAVDYGTHNLLLGGRWRF